MTDAPGPADFPLPPEVDYGGIEVNYEHPVRPTRSTFLAWHRPRKQYVRERQWSNAVGDVMAKRPTDERLKYIGLPGIDLLDLRQLLRTVCVPAGRKLQYIGFDLAAGYDSEGTTELNVSQSELDAHPGVYKPSVVRPDDLRCVGKRQTSAWMSIRDFGHVDVVNFDLTKTIFDQGADFYPSYLGALREILALQSGNPNPWVLLLTTKIDSQDVHESAARPLLQLFLCLVESCPDLCNVMEEFGLEYSDSCAVGDWRDESLQAALLTSMIEWVRRLLNDGTVSTRVRLTSCFEYTSFEGDGVADVASMVIRFDPKPTDLTDSVFPMSGSDRVDPGADEESCARFTRYYSRIASSTNIDNLLESDSFLKEEMIELSSALLVQARYSRDDYKEWVRSKKS